MGPWLFLITPGFISIGVARVLSDMGAFSEIDMVLISITLTGFNLFVVYLATSIILKKGNKSVPEIAEISKRPSWLAILFSFSIVMGFVLAFVYERELIASTGHTALNLFQDSQTPRTNFHQTLDTLLNKAYEPPFPDGRDEDYAPSYRGKKSDKKYVRIHLKAHKDMMITGRAKRWHRKGELPQLFLTPVCISNNKREMESVDGLVGIWVPLSEVTQIDFFDGEKLPCVQKLTPH